jgi:hypothetical protein
MSDFKVNKRLFTSKPNRTKLKNPAVTVGGMLSSFGSAPARSILLGQCADELPFLIELKDPQIGSILIGGSAGCGKTHQLQVMVESALRVNAPHDFQVAILTLKTNEWDDLKREAYPARYLRGVFAWCDNRAEQLIEDLIVLAEARREGQRQGPSVLFILDDIQFIETLSYKAQVNLHWLLAYGAQSDIWVVGTINAKQAQNLRYWVETFRTKFIGSIQSKRQAAVFALQSYPQVNPVEPGMFNVWTGDDWLVYRLPLLGHSLS